MSMSGGGGGRIGVPNFAGGLANWLFGQPQRAGGAFDTGGGEGTSGIGQDALRGQAGFDFGAALQNAGFQDLAQQAGLAGQNIQAGAAQQTGQALGAQNQIMGQGLGLANLQPQALAAANNFLQGGNAASQAAGSNTNQAGQILQNVMNPTAYNPLFQNAVNNQVIPGVRSGLAARGLGEGGIGQAAEMGAITDLGSQFAARQFQEQLSASQGYGNAINQQGNLAATLSQVPGAIIGQQLGNLGGASSLQNAGLGTLGVGTEVFGQGLNLPIDTVGSAYQVSRAPVDQALQAISGVAGGFQAGRQSRGLFGIRK